MSQISQINLCIYQTRIKCSIQCTSALQCSWESQRFDRISLTLFGSLSISRCEPSPHFILLWYLPILSESRKLSNLFLCLFKLLHHRGSRQIGPHIFTGSNLPRRKSGVSGHGTQLATWTWHIGPQICHILPHLTNTHLWIQLFEEKKGKLCIITIDNLVQSMSRTFMHCSSMLPQSNSGPAWKLLK